MKADKESAAPSPGSAACLNLAGVEWGEEWGGLEEGVQRCTIVGPCSVVAEWVGCKSEQDSRRPHPTRMMIEEGPFTMEPVAFDLAFPTVKVRVVSSSALRKSRQFCCRTLSEGPHILEVTLGFKPQRSR